MSDRSIPVGGWVCFHCGVAFYSFEAAEKHFGKSPEIPSECVRSFTTGDGINLLFQLRIANTELARLRAESVRKSPIFLEDCGDQSEAPWAVQDEIGRPYDPITGKTWRKT
jgi:hypothetical protein